MIAELALFSALSVCAAPAVFDEVEDAELWIGFALDKFRRSTEALGPDGASHEGVGYWEYGVEYLLKFMDPEQQSGKRDGEAFLFTGKSAAARLEALTPEGAEIEAAEVAAEGRHGEKGQAMYTVRLRRKASEWRNVVAFSWAETGRPVERVRLDAKGDAVVLQCGSRIVTLDWRTGRITRGARM